MKKVMALVPLLLVVGCGPSAVEQRACDMYVEAGGSTDKRTEATDPIATDTNSESMRKAFGETPQERAAYFTALGKETNEKARAVASARLTLSLREVDEALKKCLDSTLKRKYKAQMAR